MNTQIIYFQLKDFNVPFMIMQSIGFNFFSKIMREICSFCCSSCISFNSTSHLNQVPYSDPNHYRIFLKVPSFELVTPLNERPSWKWKYAMRFATCYHLLNLKNVENTHGGVLLLLGCNFTKSNTPPWVFFTFLKLHKWYQNA